MLSRSILSDITEFKHGIEIDLPTASTAEPEPNTSTPNGPVYSPPPR